MTIQLQVTLLKTPSHLKNVDMPLNQIKCM